MSIANATSHALIKRNPQVAENIDLNSSSWSRNLFQQMGLVKHQKTSLKVEISDAVRKEIEFLFHYKIVTYVEKFKIPHTLALNLDQTPLKYVPVSNETMAKRGSSSGSDNKRMITGIFTITLSIKFCQCNLFTGAKNIGIPKVSFPNGFSLSANPKYLSDAEES